MSTLPLDPRTHRDLPLFAVRGRLVLGKSLVPGAVVVRDGRIAEVLRDLTGASLPDAVIDAHAISPGFIDLQVNGAFGREVADDPEAISDIASRLPSTGVTVFLPTLVSSAVDVYPRACEALLASRVAAGALPLGLHLEGPFLSLRRAGAHRAQAIKDAPDDLFDAYCRYEAVRLVTLAPEAPGGLDRIRRLCSRGVVVSLGHTDASYEEFVQGIEAGARMTTHIFNAMSGFSHRAPGAIGAALVDDRVVAGLIADGVHCHTAAVRLAFRAKGPTGVALVTDAISGAGMRPGVYQLDGQDILVDETLAKLPNGKLAGSILTMDQAVRNVVDWTGCSIAEACSMASEIPAKVVGLRSKGTLAPGQDADLVLLDDDLKVAATFREGRRLYDRAHN